MSRRGTLYDAETHELIARIEHGGISTSQDAAGQLLHKAEFYVLEEIRTFLPLLKSGLVWARLAGGLEGPAFILDAQAEPGRLIYGRLRSNGSWEVRPDPATVPGVQPDEGDSTRRLRRHRAGYPGLGGPSKNGPVGLRTPGKYSPERAKRASARPA